MDNRWSQLSMSEKNQLLGIYASKGYTDLASIISHYNSFATGGQMNTDGSKEDKNKKGHVTFGTYDEYGNIIPMCRLNQVNIGTTQPYRTPEQEAQVTRERNMYFDAMRHFNYGNQDAEGLKETYAKYSELRSYLKRIGMSENDFMSAATGRDYETNSYERERTRQFNKDIQKAETDRANTFMQAVQHQNPNDQKLAAIMTGILGGVTGTSILSGAGLLDGVVSGASKVLTNPIVDAGLTVHGAITAPNNIKEGISELQEGRYGAGALDLGMTALDLLGAGNLLNKGIKFARSTNKVGDIMNTGMSFAEAHPQATIAATRAFAHTPMGKRMAEVALRGHSALDTNTGFLTDVLRDNSKYILTGRGGIKQTRLNTFPISVFDKEKKTYVTLAPQLSTKGDIDDVYLHGASLDPALGVLKPELGFGIHTDYITKNYPSKIRQIPVYEVGPAKLPNNNQAATIREALLDNKVTFSTDYMLGKDVRYGINTGGHAYIPTLLDGKPAFYEQDIYKYNPQDYLKKWTRPGQNTLLHEVGLNLLDAAGTPVIVRSTPTLLSKGGELDTPEIPPQDPTITVTNPLFTTTGTIYRDYYNDSWANKYAFEDTMKGIELAGDYFASEGFKSRANAANKKFGQIYDVAKPLGESVPKEATFLIGYDNANADFVFGLENPFNHISVGAHEVGHHNPVFNNFTLGMTPEEKTELSNPESTLYSPYYGNDYRRIPEEWRNILKPRTEYEEFQSQIDDHDAELSEAYSDLIGLRALLKAYNIFDSTDPKAKFTQEMLDAFRKKLGNKSHRFLDYHSDENIIRAINEIAQNNSSQNTTNYAAYGGKLKQ